MKVIAYQSPKGNTINLTPDQIHDLEAHSQWPRDWDGQEYCRVSHGLHEGTPIDSDVLEQYL
jgi:hypothetical protein